MRNNGTIQLVPLLRVAVCLAAGVWAGYALDGYVGLGWWFGLLVASVLATIISWRLVLLQGGLIALSAFLLGAVLMSRQLTVLQRPLPVDEVTGRAVVASAPQQRGKVVRVDLWVTDGVMAGQRVKASVLNDSLSRPSDRLHIGDGITFSSVMQPPVNFSSSHFDYPLYLQCHGFTATTLLLPGHWRKTVVSLRPLSYLDRTVLAALRLRQTTMSHYLRMGLDDDEMAVAVAMALGDRSRLTNDLRDLYSVSGASHVLALSGLHLGIIYVLLTLLVGSRRLGWWRELLLLAGIWSYAVFTGLSPSVVRASTMITVFSVASMLHRQRMSLNVLAFTAILMLVVHPLNLFDVGFQMSFLAVLSILIFYRPVVGLVSSEYQMRHPVVKWVWTMVVVSCCAQMGVAPLTAYYFGRFSVYFLLTNFFVIPLATVVLYLTALMFIAALIPPLLPLFARLLAWVVGAQTWLVRWVASLPGSSIEGITINRLQLLMVYVFIASLTVIIYKLLRIRNTI
jgi:competence protein ComEC